MELSKRLIRSLLEEGDIRADGENKALMKVLRENRQALGRVQIHKERQRALLRVICKVLSHRGNRQC